MSKQSYIRKKTGLTDRISRIFLLIALVVIALIFQIIQPRFLMMNNVMNLLATSSIIGVLTLGNMILMRKCCLWNRVNASRFRAQSRDTRNRI